MTKPNRSTAPSQEAGNTSPQAVILPFKARARARTMTGQTIHEDVSIVLDAICDAHDRMAEIEPAKRSERNRAIDTARETWDVAAEALLSFEAKWEGKRWNRAAGTEVVRGFVQEKRAELRDLSVTMLGWKRIAPFVPQSLPHLVALPANLIAPRAKKKSEARQ